MISNDIGYTCIYYILIPSDSGSSGRCAAAFCDSAETAYAQGYNVHFMFIISHFFMSHKQKKKSMRQIPHAFPRFFLLFNFSLDTRCCHCDRVQYFIQFFNCHNLFFQNQCTDRSAFSQRTFCQFC